MAAHLYLIRGVPGSGKTTLATALWDAHIVDHHFEADMFMVDERGRYSFDPARLKDYHARCLEATRKALAAGDTVVVANTFTRVWEMQPYIDLGYPVTVIRCEGNYLNMHGVPAEKVAEMRARFEDWPGEGRT